MLTFSRRTGSAFLLLLLWVWCGTFTPSVTWPIAQMIFAALLILNLITDEYTGVNAANEHLDALSENNA